MWLATQRSKTIHEREEGDYKWIRAQLKLKKDRAACSVRCMTRSREKEKNAQQGGSCLMHDKQIHAIVGDSARDPFQI